jgi:soluble lytic murein transglycosylase-like protein
MVMKRTTCAWAAVLVRIMGAANAAEPPIYCGTGQWQTFIDEAASRSGVSPRWLSAVMHAESAGCEVTDHRPTTSAAGAMGLMQLMPATWLHMKQRYGLGDDPYDPHDNILAAAGYLRELRARYGTPGFIVAYQAGPERLNDYLLSGRPLPVEALEYLSRVERYEAALDGSRNRFGNARDIGSGGLLIELSHHVDDSRSSADRQAHSGPFVGRKHTNGDADRQTETRFDERSK